MTADAAAAAKVGGAGGVASASAATATAGSARSTNPFLSGGAATNQLCQDDDLVFEEFARIRLKGHEGEEATQELGEPAGDVEA